eukprot:Selendium_serpulae@DN5779_c0_g1_i2.p1
MASKVASEMRDAGRNLGVGFLKAPELNQIKEQEQMKATFDRYSKEKKQLVVMLISKREYKKEAKFFGEPNFPSQFLLRDKFASANNQYWANVIAKVNQKTKPLQGPWGINQNVHDSTAKNAMKAMIGNDSTTMILAASMSRAPFKPGGRNISPCLAGLVGAVDNNCLIYNHSVRAVARTETIIPDEKMYSMFKDLMEQRTKLYIRTAPKRIIYLRDGVSEGQFEQVLREAQQIAKWYSEQNIEKPKITLIITQRHHQTRFFPRDKNLEGNAPPGTVVLDDLTHPTPYPNFYLLSHAGIIGTSHPCRYFVLRDENRFQRDVLLHGMFQLCHVYGRCTRSVSIPAPCFYAKLLVERCLDHTNVHIQNKLQVNLADDSVSLSSGGASNASALPSAQAVIEEVQPWLEDLSVKAQPFFYC